MAAHTPTRIHAREAFDLLRDLAKAETQQRLAKRLKISPQYLCDVLNGRRELKGILARLGYQQVILYEKRRKA
jgi:hypothetical protein